MPELTLQFLNARDGDAIWVRWAGRQLLIDMGRGQTAKRIRKALLDLPVEQRRFELLVITHVDADHIGGAISALVDGPTIPGLSFGDVWFNGWPHLQQAVADETRPLPGGNEDELEPLGVAQGEEFSIWLRGQRWNRAFGGSAVARTSDATPFDLGDGLHVRVLGPTRKRLAALAPDWESAVEAAITDSRLSAVPAGLEALGAKEPPVLDDEVDLQLLAETWSKVDDKAANGSSIQLLLEYGERRILLTGDAFGEDAAEAIRTLQSVPVGSESVPVKLDLVKVPHHGSQRNVSEELVKVIDTPLWVFSTDGSRHGHPHSEAVARILQYGVATTPTLAFNVRSTYSGWWDNDRWRKMLGYEVVYGTEADGLTVRFDENGSSFG